MRVPREKDCVATDPPEKKTAYLELGFSPNIDLVSIVRGFVMKFYERVLDDAELTSRVAVASHELLENAVKYSIDGDTKMRLEVSYDAERIFVQLEMRNRASREHIATLHRLFDEMSQKTPQDFYLALMERASRSKVGSCLGLGRILAEADMTLALKVTDDWVCVGAETLRTKESAA
jgi:hypothetical protein